MTTTISRFLSTGQGFRSPQEVLEFFGEVEGEVAQEVGAVAEEGLGQTPERFLRGSAGLGHELFAGAVVHHAKANCAAPPKSIASSAKL